MWKNTRKKKKIRGEGKKYAETGSGKNELKPKSALEIILVHIEQHTKPSAVKKRN